MSFGFGVGDFLAVLEIVHRVRKKAARAPKEYQGIAEEVKILGRAIHAAVNPEHDDDLSASQELQEITQSCQNVLKLLENELDRFAELGRSQGAVVSLRDRVKRGWQRFRFDAADIRNVREQLTSHLQSFNTVQIQNNGKNIKSIVEGVDKLNILENDGELHRKRNEILDWITTEDYSPTHCDNISRRHAGTGQWFINSTEFQDWLGSTGQTLYCPGLPGAGKTTLTAIVIDHLLARFTQTPDNNIGIAYIYFNFKTRAQQTEDDILASLLTQLCRLKEAIPEDIQKHYDKLGETKRERRLTHFELIRFLETVARNFQKVLIVLDALDECRFDTMSRLMRDLFDIQKTCKINLFATSRNIPGIAAEFNTRGSAVSMEIRASEEDVLKYLDGQMSRLPLFAQRDRDLQEQISTKIAKSVQGMFLLAQLHFEPMLTKTTKKQVLKALSRLQGGSEAYSHAYKEAMVRIGGQSSDHADLAKKVLAWIACAKRPLRVMELQHALAVEEGEDEIDEDNIPEVEEIVGVCAGLVTIDEQSNIIRLVHYTTQEYFQRTQKNWFPDGEGDLGTACLRYISFPVFENVPSDLQKRLASHPFYSYASSNWGNHLHENWGECKELLGAYQKSEEKVAASAEAVELPLSIEDSGKPGNGLVHERAHWSQLTGLHLMVYFGLHEALDFFLDDWESPDAKTSAGGWTLLSWAAVYGHEEVARLLISRGATVKTWDTADDRTPLWLASYYGHTKVVELLLESGANPRARDRQLRDPMMVATMNGHESAARAILVRDKLSAFSYERETRTTTLMYASMFHFEGIVRMLLEILKGHIIPLCRLNKLGQSALSLAVWMDGNSNSCRMAVIRLLLDAGAIISSIQPSKSPHMSQSRESRPLLLRPAQKGEVELLKLLLDRGAKTEVVDGFGRTPLSWATECHKPSSPVLEMLLAAGANTEAKDKRGWAPLFHAGPPDHDRAVDAFRLLLQYGADVNTRDIAGRTILMLLVDELLECDQGERRRHLWEHLRKIVTAGADLEARDVSGRKALQDAMAFGDQELADFLIDSGSKKDILDVDRCISATQERRTKVAAIYARAGWRPRGG